MSDIAIIILSCCAAYVAVGLGTAVAFLAGGAVRILPEPTSISLGARFILLPGVVVLWPVVAGRLLHSRVGS